MKKKTLKYSLGLLSLCLVAVFVAYAIADENCPTEPPLDCYRCNDTSGCGGHVVLDPSNSIPIGCTDSAGMCVGTCFKCSVGSRRDFCRKTTLPVTCTLSGRSFSCGKTVEGHCNGQYGPYGDIGGCGCGAFGDPTEDDCMMCAC